MKPLSFVSQRRAPYNGTLCGSLLPANRRSPERRAQLASGKGLRAAQRCCWTSFRSARSARGAQRGKQTEQGIVENAESSSWRNSIDLSVLGASALPASSCDRRREALAPRALSQGLEAGNRHPCLYRQPSRVLSLNAEVLSLSHESVGKGWGGGVTKKGEKDFLEL